MHGHGWKELGTPLKLIREGHWLLETIWPSSRFTFRSDGVDLLPKRIIISKPERSTEGSDEGSTLGYIRECILRFPCCEVMQHILEHNQSVAELCVMGQVLKLPPNLPQIHRSTYS